MGWRSIKVLPAYPGATKYLALSKALTLEAATTTIAHHLIRYATDLPPNYQYPARIAQEKAEVLVRLPKPVRDIAWKA